MVGLYLLTALVYLPSGSPRAVSSLKRAGSAVDAIKEFNSDLEGDGFTVDDMACSILELAWYR